MFDSGLPHGHITKHVNEYTWSTGYEFNNTPTVASCWFDSDNYWDDHGLWLYFDWSHDIRYFFRNWKI